MGGIRGVDIECGTVLNRENGCEVRGTRSVDNMATARKRQLEI